MKQFLVAGVVIKIQRGCSVGEGGREECNSG